MMGIKHSYLMAALLVAGVVLLVSEVAGSAVFLLWPLACAGMMIAMLWGMRGMGKPTQDTHDDALTRPRR